MLQYFYVRCVLCVCSSHGSERSSKANDVVRSVRCDWSVCYAYLCRQRQRQVRPHGQTTTAGNVCLSSSYCLSPCGLALTPEKFGGHNAFDHRIGPYVWITVTAKPKLMAFFKWWFILFLDYVSIRVSLDKMIPIIELLRQFISCGSTNYTDQETRVRKNGWVGCDIL